MPRIIHTASRKQEEGVGSKNGQEEAGNRKREADSRKQEAGRRKQEAGSSSRKEEAGSTDSTDTQTLITIAPKQSGCYPLLACFFCSVWDVFLLGLGCFCLVWDVFWSV